MSTWSTWAESTLATLQSLADAKLAEAAASSSSSSTSTSSTASPLVEASELVKAAASLKTAIDVEAIRTLAETTGFKITTAQYEASPGEAGKMQRAMMVLPLLKDSAKLKEIQAEMANPTKIV